MLLAQVGNKIRIAQPALYDAEEFFGLRPPSWTLIQHTSETILRLVELGNVIIIGRAGAVISGRRPDVLHVRFVAPEATRVERIIRDRAVDREKATELARTEDRGRARYLKKYFDADIDDAELYHMTFNTSAMDQGRIVDILASLVRGGTGM